MIRPLTRDHDAAIWSLFQASADYVRMERDEEPRPYLLNEFFDDAPPGLSAADGYRAGLFDGGVLIALAEMSFGFPQKSDCYLGLMMVRVAARGKGSGVQMLRHVEGVARDRQARQMFLAVLDANLRGRAFWEREGFVETGFRGAVTLGQKTQRVQRLVKPL